MVKLIKIGTILLNALYSIIKLLPTRHKVTMISRQSNNPSNEFLLVEKELKEKDKNVKVVLMCRTLDGGVNSSVLNKLKYCMHMLEQMVQIATSKVVVLDSYCIVISILRHKKNLKVIQMWHSMGSMKKFGYTSLDTEEGSKSELAYAMKMHHNYDYVFASAEAYKEHLAKGFNCDIKKIVTMPLPRLDLLNSEEYARSAREKIYAQYPELCNKPTILYCPTFRKQEEQFEKALDKLIQAVDTEKYNLVIKLHPLSKVNVTGNVILAREISSFDMIFVADYFISDYSCIVYEAAVRNIPLFFYNFDMELYTDTRGLAIDYYKELPGVISAEAETIAQAIEMQQMYHTYDMDALKKFAEKYVKPTKHATKDIVEFIEQFM